MIDFSLWDEGAHTVEVQGCDASNKCSVISQVVDNSALFQEPEPVPAEPVEETEASLPAPGIWATMVSAFAALIYRRRSD